MDASARPTNGARQRVPEPTGGRLPDEVAVRVVVADDNPLIALDLSERLRSLGREPLGPAADGQEAIELVNDEDRKLVERAKGLLMSALNLSEDDALRRLQLTARERNLRLVEVAARIVEQQSVLEPKRTTNA
jgi:AmiR/NasT family two-component response regulator